MGDGVDIGIVVSSERQIVFIPDFWLTIRIVSELNNAMLVPKWACVENQEDMFFTQNE